MGGEAAEVPDLTAAWAGRCQIWHRPAVALVAGGHRRHQGPSAHQLPGQIEQPVAQRTVERLELVGPGPCPEFGGAASRLTTAVNG